jgi:preprotein translocase subunit SecB
MKFADVNLLSVNFHLNEQFNTEEKEDSFVPEIALDSFIVKEKKEMAVLLGIRKLEGNLPYYFEVRAGGLFTFDKLPTKKMLDQFSSINCPAILFPYIRETVADLTRRAGFPPLHLDPINFIEMAKDNKKTKNVKKSPTPK